MLESGRTEYVVLSNNGGLIFAVSRLTYEAIRVSAGDDAYGLVAEGLEHDTALQFVRLTHREEE